MNEPYENQDTPSHDPALSALADRLDRLGDADGRMADDGLEDRVLAGVARVYAPEPILIAHAGTPWWRSGAVRLAAGVAIAAGVGVMLFSQVRPGTPAPEPGSPEVLSVALVEQRIEGLLALASDSGDDLRNQIATVELWADAVGVESAGLWDGEGLTEWDRDWNGAL